MKIVFMGTPDFAVSALRRLAEKHEIVCVYTQAPKEAGRGKKLTKSPVHIFAEENLLDKIIINENLFNGSNMFVLKVKGDSMVNVGIYDGDLVVISKQSVANNGEIVACLIDNEATVKRYYKENGYFRLQPENSFMRPILTDHLEILGKFVGLIRNKF